MLPTMIASEKANNGLVLSSFIISYARISFSSPYLAVALIEIDVLFGDKF